MNFILQLLNISLVSLDSWQMSEVGSILNATTREFTTIAFFGHVNAIEDFTKAEQLKQMPQLVVTRNYGNINFNDGSHINRKIFFIAVGYLHEKALWNHLSNALQGIQSRTNGVFITKRPEKKYVRLDMEEHFRWCWGKGLTNALILLDLENTNIRQYQIYNYNHFKEPRVINMTGFSKEDLYPDKFRDLNRFKIRTLAAYDPPRVFERGSCINSNNKRQFLGYMATLFQTFLKEYNADTQLLYSNKTQVTSALEIFKLVQNDDVDLVINPCIAMEGTHLSYPIRMQRRCFVLPFPNQLAKYKYFIMPFDTEIWLAFLITWLVMSLAKIYGRYFGNQTNANRSLDVSHTFLDVWRIFICLPSSLPSYYKYHKWFHCIWFCLIATIGFILSNLYLASLTSFFSRLNFDSPINTLADMIRSNITVDAIDYELPWILHNRDLPYGLSEMLKGRNYFELMADVLSLKENMSYTALEDQIYFALHQQMHLKKPISHVVSECLTTLPFGILMPRHSQFEIPLNRFSLRCAASGLIQKWSTDSIQDGLCAGIISMRIPQLRVDQPLMLEHFQFGWFVLVGGYILGFVVFLFENMGRICKRIKIFIVYL